MSALLDAVRWELSTLERSILECMGRAFDDARQRLTTLAVEPGGNDPRAEPGSIPVGRVETIKMPK